MLGLCIIATPYFYHSRFRKTFHQHLFLPMDWKFKYNAAKNPNVMLRCDTGGTRCSQRWMTPGGKVLQIRSKRLLIIRYRREPSKRRREYNKPKKRRRRRLGKKNGKIGRGTPIPKKKASIAFGRQQQQQVKNYGGFSSAYKSIIYAKKRYEKQFAITYLHI